MFGEGAGVMMSRCLDVNSRGRSWAPEDLRDRGPALFVVVLADRVHEDLLQLHHRGPLAGHVGHHPGNGHAQVPIVAIERFVEDMASVL